MGQHGSGSGVRLMFEPGHVEVKPPDRILCYPAASPFPGTTSRIFRRVPDLDMFARPSRDGKYLAFTDRKSGNLAVRDVVTGATQALTKNGTLGGGKSQHAMFSSWSRDSRKVAYQWNAEEAKGAVWNSESSR
jgi:hypothetical protein